MAKLLEYLTKGGVTIARTSTLISDSKSALKKVLGSINSNRGAVFASGYEYPGRYSRWDIGFVNPPIEFVSRGRTFHINALNERGENLLHFFAQVLESDPCIEGSLAQTKDSLSGVVIQASDSFSEEERLRQPTIFSVLRTLVGALGSSEDSHLGFYGAFGYDLVFQFEPIAQKHPRKESQTDLHLFLPDKLVVTDHRLEKSYIHKYDFKFGKCDTKGLRRQGKKIPFCPGVSSPKVSDHKVGEYANKVKEVVGGTKAGDFFEVVLSQKFSAGYPGTPRELFELIRQLNPSPYEFLINLGKEQLVGASPEMFVEVDGSRVVTCPISGTIRRGKTPMEDAKNILILLNSLKDEYELTMATDVDRNDKARICKVGTIVLLARRLIEAYSRLFHTVDMVAGELRDDKDGIDALSSHMWAGTLTGAPKLAAMQRIEELENSARGWYGGCVGMLLFNGNIKTGITIRTVHLEGGVASVRAGSTLLAYSDPESEEMETQLKASAFMDAVLQKSAQPSTDTGFDIKTGVGKKVLLVDNCDSFVHTLGDYIRQTGAETVTHRAEKGGISFKLLDKPVPDLVFISPGPGRPEEFKVPELVLECTRRGIPVFGVCLGLQGVVEAFGGKLGILTEPMHGVDSRIYATKEGIQSGIIPERDFVAGRYHSLYAIREEFPDCLEVLAGTEDGVIMAIQHKDLPIAAVQFHPESLLTMDENVGLRLIASVIKKLTN